MKEEPVKKTSKSGKENVEKANFERIVEKLLEYNEKINGGREISVLDYLTRIDPLSTFLRQYEN
jgi:KaiC/GvpD/RAD55 family RecA-like ATPase